MTNVILFFNSFFSHLLVFAIIVALVVIACIIGAKWSRSSDAKAGKTDGPSMPDTVNINNGK